jgi:DNA-binding winged helix-turn-helix (wHTH) protein/tetratricopeptide (TPR) repeat protein
MITEVRHGRAIDLAVEPPFAIGSIRVHPPTRQIEIGGAARTLEPRVMQVLVLLAGARGAVVSRDALIEQCWDGRIVSEAAINRVIAALRRVAAEAGEDGFRIETITRVGYRLSEAACAPPNSDHAWRVPQADDAAAVAAADVPAPGPLTRRAALALGGIGLAAGAGGAVWWVATADERAQVRNVRELIAKSRGFTWLEATPDGDFQAIDYAREATRVAPDSAEAWGALAIALEKSASLRTDVGLELLAAQVRSAAARALQLDADTADAHVALALIAPRFGRWGEREAALTRLLRRFPEHHWLRFNLGYDLTMAGLHSQAVPHFARILAEDPLHAYGHYALVNALWTVGRVEEAERVLEKAFRTWRMTFWIWIQRFNFLALTGRPREALAQAEDERLRPSFPWPSQTSLASARALASRAAREVETAVTLLLDTRPEQRFPHFMAVMYLSALGAVDAAYDLIDRAVTQVEQEKPVPFVSLMTAHLFMPPTRPLRADARFEPLMRRLGLDRYWRESGKVPDYRRAGG